MRDAAFCIAGAVTAAVMMASPSRAQDIDLSGETIEWTVPFSEGGGTDTIARFLSPIFAKHLPGEPEVVVRNVPGGGSITGANQFVQRARPDGLTVLHTGGSTAMPYILQNPQVRYDYRDLVPVIAVSSGAVIYTKPEFGVEGIADIGELKNQELVFASQGASSLDLVTMWGFRLLDLDVRPVFGMTGSGDKRLAFERGEATIDNQTAFGYIENVQPQAEAGEVVPLYAIGVIDEEGNLARDPSFPDLPHFGEAYEAMHGSPPEGDDFEIMKALIAAGYQAEKFLFLPEGTPSEVVDVWREAATKVVQDPDFLERRQEIMGEYPEVIHPQIESLLQTATSMSDESRSTVVDWLAAEFNYAP